MGTHELDPADDLPVHDGGQLWSLEKLSLIERYTKISSKVRRKFLPPRGYGANYIDLYCSFGRIRMKDSADLVDGSALAAVKAAQEDAPFSGVYIADLDADKASVCAERLRSIGASVSHFVGPSTETVEQILPLLRPGSLNFCVLDPYGLNLPLALIDRLISVDRMDVMVLVSAMELQRNLKFFLSGENDTLDHFAPGWRDCFEPGESESAIRTKIMQYWRGLLEERGLSIANTWKMVRGLKNQPLYWFGLFGKHPLAAEFFDKISGRASPQTGFDF